jgi:hypothetical protein
MDLPLYFRVMWRFRVIVAIGTLVAVVLTFLTLVRVDLKTHSLAYRSSEQWVSYSRIFVTQRGFPYGEVDTGSGNPATLASNAILYSNLATSDPVLELAFGKNPPPATAIQAAPVLASANSSDALPIVSIAATAATRESAVHIAQLETLGLIRYIRIEQSRASTPEKNRVVLQVIQQPRTATLLKGRSKTLPVVVFLSTMLAVMALAFILENLRPRVRPEAADPVPLPSRSQVA